MTTGQAAPGYGPGATISGSGLGWSNANAAGQVPFEATVVGPGLHPDGETAIFRWTNGTLELIARTGDSAPQLGAGATFSSVGGPSILPNGTVTYFATANGDFGNFSHWSSPPALAGPEQPVVRVGQNAPGIGGATLADYYWIDFTSGGHASWASALSGAGFDSLKDSAIFGGPIANATVLARSNTQAPGMPAGVQLKHFSDFSYRDNGDSLFSGAYEGASVGFGNGQALWHRDSGGSTAVLAQSGEQALGLAPGYHYADQMSARMLDNGDLVMSASLYAPGDSESRDFALWMGPSDNLQPVLQSGQAMPDVSGALLRTVNSFQKLGDGQFVVAGVLKGPGIDANTNAFAIWDGPLNDLSLVWRQGDDAPGLSGVVSTALLDFQNDDAGNYLIRTQLAGNGVTDENDEALWLYDPAGLAYLLAREGETILIDGVEWIFGSAHGALAPGNAGLVTMMVSRSDGNDGFIDSLVLVQIPEPAGPGMVALAAIALLGTRRRMRTL